MKSCQLPSDRTVAMCSHPLAAVSTDLLDVPVLLTVIYFLCAVLRDNLPMSDIKAKQWNRPKTDFLHAVIFKVLEKKEVYLNSDGKASQFILNVRSNINFPTPVC